jgi:predicted PurR-regulated permease PerM
MPSNPVNNIIAVLFIALFFAVMIWPMILELQRSKLNMVKIALFFVVLFGATAILTHTLNGMFIRP